MRKDNLLAYELQMQMKTSENCISFSRAHSISVCLVVCVCVLGVGAVCDGGRGVHACLANHVVIFTNGFL